jgi:cytochrome c5
MLRHLVPSVVILAVAVTSAAAAAAPIEFKSVNIDLPDSDKMFRDGPGSDTINNNCLACHSADMVLNQPAMPKDVWKSEVDKMISTYKAPIAAEDVTAIVDYLAAVKGTK